MAKVVKKEKIIDGLIDLITSVEELSSIHFNYTLHIATIVLDNSKNIIKKPNTPPRVIFIYNDNHKKLSNKLISNKQEPDVIDK
ncbi:12067_t:CDS:1, partial [Dentiscutata heterogama]